MSYFYDEAAGMRVVRFFETELSHVKGEWAGKRVRLEQWQISFLTELFGWKDSKTGLRKYRAVWLEIPRKNGKSFWASGLGLYMTFADKEKGAEVVAAAADRDQASIVFDTSLGMMRENQKMKALGEAYVKSILVRSTASYYKVISAEAFSKHGLNLHSFIVDEVHAQPNRDLIDVLRTSIGARRQPLEIYLTTAGFDKNTICWEMHDYACKVRDGIIIDPTFLPVIYAAGDDDDWTKEATWKKANPNYGISIKPEYFDRECKRAMEVPTYENTFKRLHLNMWTEQDVRWIPMPKWRECGGNYTAESLYGRECYAGLDLSSTTDLSAFVLIFPEEDGRYKTLTYFWAPADNMGRRERKDRVPYSHWLKEKALRATPGNIIDYDCIRRDINELGDLFNIKEVAIDRWNATQLATQLDGDGFNVVMFGQGYASMSAPSKELIALIYSRRIEHNNNPVMNWMAGNAAAEQDAAGNVKPNKAKSSDRIDGVVALVMALGRAAVHDDFRDSAYADRGLLIL